MESNTVKVLLALLFTVILFTAILVIGLGSVDKSDTIAHYNACMTLPVSKRPACINPPQSPEQVCSGIANNYNNSGAGPFNWQQCVEDYGKKP